MVNVLIRCQLSAPWNIVEFSSAYVSDLLISSIKSWLSTVVILVSIGVLSHEIQTVNLVEYYRDRSTEFLIPKMKFNDKNLLVTQ